LLAQPATSNQLQAFAFGLHLLILRIKPVTKAQTPSVASIFYLKLILKKANREATLQCKSPARFLEQESQIFYSYFNK